MLKSNKNASRRSSWVAGTAAAALLSASPAAYGAGFQINEHAAAATGRASAVTATVKDPSAIFHNPAGLTQTKGTQFQVGVNFILPRGEYQGPGIVPAPGGGDVTQEASSSPVPVPNVYASMALSDTAYVGLGFYAPYGLGISWKDPDTFVGRTQVHELSLRSFFFTPTIALKLSEMVSFAVSVSLVPATVYLKRTLGATDNGQVLFPSGLYSKEGTVEIGGTAFGVGANAGLQLTLIENLKVGLNYRSAIDLSFSGDANFDIPEEAPVSVRANFPDQTGTADVTLPHAFSFGVGWDDDNFTVEASAQINLWTSYEELRVNFDTGRPAPSSASPRNWEVVPLIRVGGEYRLDDLSIRLGLAWDQSPAPQTTVDFTLPDNDRLIGSLGLGYDFGMFRFDAAYMGLYVNERDIAPGENVNLQAGGKFLPGLVHVLSSSIGVKI